MHHPAIPFTPEPACTGVALSPFLAPGPVDKTKSTHRLAYRRRGSILIADDDPVTSSLLSNLCTKLGEESVVVADGSEALAHIEKQAYDLVLLDRRMPGFDGLHVLREIRSAFSEAELPVVVVTSDSDMESTVAAFEMGANDYITKPFHSLAVMARIRTHLRIQHIQRQLATSQSRYELVVMGTNDGVWDWDLDAGVMYFSPRWQAMMGLREEELYGFSFHWFSRIHEDDRERVDEALRLHMDGKTPHFETEFRMQRANDEYRWMVCRGRAVFDDRGNARRMAGSLTDVTGGKSADALTALPNRVLFFERASRRCEQFKRDPSRQFAMLYIDVDEFKHINDTYGHAAGDNVLVAIADRLEGSIRRPDSVVARLGGDEFAILLEDIETTEAAREIASRLIESVSAPIVLPNKETIQASVSLGVAFSPPALKSADELLQYADAAMYESKREGKNRYQVYGLGTLPEKLG